ncbi:MAG: outer membrane protein assembly factor BamB [Chlamydiales bacterium]|jgi:outer membrane protein assembly factor BamB
MTPIDNTQRAATVRAIQLKEYGTVHGVTCDSAGNVCFAAGDGDLVCVAPESGRVVRQFKDIGATAGTAFDGTHLWQLTDDTSMRIDPESGEVVHTLPAPAGVHCSGMAHAEVVLWIGDWDGKSLLKVDIETSKVEKA